MATILRQALGQGQQPAQARPPMQLGSGGEDPVQVLMNEYKRLENATPSGPMYSPEEQTQRVQRNDNMVGMGLLGQASGDEALGRIGGSVFKQALAERQPIHDQRGTMDPLTGQRQMDPAYQDSIRTQQRTHLLDKALAFEDQRTRAAERAQQAHDTNLTRQMIADARWGDGGGGGGGKGYNRQIITDPTTGKQYWADPRTMQVVAPVVADGNPLVKPDKMNPPDEKALSGLTQEKAVLSNAMQAVVNNPKAFGIVKGLPSTMGVGPLAQAVRSKRDEKMPQEYVKARAAVFNNVSAVIKERAGTAQSKQELERLNSFLPSDMDSAPAILSKFNAYQEYIGEKEGAIRTRYAARPTVHLGGGQPPAPGAGTGAPAGAQPVASATPPQPGRTRLRLNPATGDLEPVQ